MLNKGKTYKIKIRRTNFERSDSKSSSRGGGFRRRVACTYFHIPLLPQKKELSDYKCRIKVRYKNFERSDGKSSSRGGGFRRRVACTYFHIPLLPQKKELSDYKCRIKVKSTKI